MQKVVKSSLKFFKLSIKLSKYVMSIVTEANTILLIMSTGVFETCRELELIHTKKRIVRQVGYLQEMAHVTVGQYVSKQTPRAPIVLR
jgi:hypothetical protein